MGWDGMGRNRIGSPHQPSHLGHTLRKGHRLMLLFSYRHTLSLSGTCLLGYLLYSFTPSEGTEKPRKKAESSLGFQGRPPHFSPLILSSTSHMGSAVPALPPFSLLHSPAPLSPSSCPNKADCASFFSLKAFLVCLWIVGSSVLMLGEAR